MIIDKEICKEAAKYSLDLSKLIFGGIILAGLMNFGINQIVLFVFGLLAVIVTAFVGFSFIKLSKSKGK